MNTEDQDRFPEHIPRNGEIASMALSADDVDTYLPLLDGMELAEQHKRECIAVLWAMMRMCVEMNISAENWGQIAQGLICAACAESTGIDSE